MDFNLKQWRHESGEQEEQQDTISSEGPSSLNLPKLVLNSSLPDSSAPALPFSVPQITTNLSPLYSSSSDYIPDITSTTKFNPRMGSYFSLGQWQELELQALIFRHMIAGAAVPPELLHIVKKSLITSNPPSPYYFQHYYPHYQPSLVQSGHWGRAAMDPEPGRCRRTDGKKWRCSRDVVPAQKYCERHVHRGRNRSRKPVEIPTSTTNNAAGESLKSVTNNTITTQEMSSNGGIPLFTLSGPSPSMDLLHLSRRPIIETKGPFEAHNDTAQSGGARTLRHFFNDWPRSLNDADSTINSATNLSISTSDFSLKLGTGDVESSARGERERPHLNWALTWESSPMAPMGGPLAEALRSSTSNNSSPTSVLHRLARCPTSEASYVSS